MTDELRALLVDCLEAMRHYWHTTPKINELCNRIDAALAQEPAPSQASPSVASAVHAESVAGAAPISAVHSPFNACMFKEHCIQVELDRNIFLLERDEALRENAGLIRQAELFSNLAKTNLGDAEYAEKELAASRVFEASYLKRVNIAESEANVLKAQLVYARSCAEKAEFELAAIKISLDEAGKDAERYRWIKERTEYRSLGNYCSLRMPEFQLPDGPRSSSAPDRLDAAIEVARRTAKDF